MRNIRLSASSNGTRNIGFGGGANLLEEGVFSPSPRISTSSYYVPGTGNPAVSTADYYLQNGLYPLAPFDLRTAGTAGADIEAREGHRYLWILAPDHPDGSNFQGSSDFRTAYSDDPQILPSPTTMRQFLPYNTAISFGSQTNYVNYHFFSIVYNPDAVGDKFHIYTEAHSNASFQHELGLITTNDFLTYTIQQPAIPTTASGGWSSFGYPVRVSTGNWWVVALSDSTGYAGLAYYTSTDGVTFTYSAQITPNAGSGGGFKNIISGSSMSPVGRYVTYQSQEYVLCIEQLNSGASGEDTYATLVAIDASKNLLASPAPIRLTNAYDQAYPGPTQVQGIGAYNEDGIMHFFVNRGFPTSASVYGVVDGVPYSAGGGLWQQFVDRYRFIYDSTAAADAAPVGVKASCAGGVVTLTWDNALPNNTYRIYKGSSSGTQSTLVGDVAGFSTTHSPTTGQQWWFKVVTLNAGVEKGSRVVHCYVSNNTVMVNNHVNRVIDDGGDSSKIDMTFLASVDSYLTSNDYYKYLLHWVDARFGIKVDGSGFVSKVYCLGTTRMPRGGDYTPTTSNTFPSTTSNTSYSATSFRGTTPSWVNNASSAHGYFGNGIANNIQRKSEITLIAAYQKPGTAVATLFGTGQFASGMYLQHASGSSGNVNFVMYASNDPPASGPITSSAAFSSATAAHIAAGVFDGSNMTTYLDGVAGTPVDASSYSNSALTSASVLRGKYGSTASTSVVLASGGRGIQTLSTRAYTIDNEALATFACLAVFEKGLGSTAIGAITAMYA